MLVRAGRGKQPGAAPMGGRVNGDGNLSAPRRATGARRLARAYCGAAMLVHFAAEGKGVSRGVAVVRAIEYLRRLEFLPAAGLSQPVKIGARRPVLARPGNRACGRGCP